MVTVRLPRSTRRRAMAPAVGLTAALTLAMIAGPTLPAAGGPTDPPDPTPAGTTAATTATSVTSTGGADESRSYQVTLLTGDVVTYTVAADGAQTAWVDEPADQPAARVYEQDGHVHVIPAEAQPYLESGTLDPRLFDITLLVDQGFHDDAAAELPLIVTAADGPSTKSAPAPLPGTETTQDVPSIDAVAVTADKERLDDVWSTLHGDRPLTLSADEARFTDVGEVWLNGRVEAALDESVAQVGAPTAWAEGLDGSGVTVAVLDTGYDPTHPDLAERVVGAEDFTGEDITGPEGSDTHGHGTHVASTIAGSGAASDGAYTGVAPGADLLIGRVLNSDGFGTEAQIIAAMEWAVAEGADVVNMSLGSGYGTDGSDPMSQAVDTLSASSDALFVVAAGNNGPWDQTVESPGVATSALTVGAVTKDDAIADYSARGPRFGDDAIKPEIVAPGSGILAARAAGTSLGNLYDEHYTALNGTSMATPHVAGAAAILAQQHPEWTGEQLKARLVSTSLPLDDAPMKAQGAGRLDVAAAISDTIEVSDGVVALHAADGDDVLSQTVTLSNPSDQRVTVRLTGDLANFDAAVSGKPVLRFEPSVLSIPAGAQATTRVSVDPGKTPGGSYTGRIVAQDPRNRDLAVRIATSFTLARPLHELRVTGIDRNGEPGATITDAWNEATGETQRIFGWDGTAAAELPEGDYTLVTLVKTAAGWQTMENTIAGEPEVALDRDVTLTYDARDAEPVDVRTDLPTDLDRYHLSWARETDTHAHTEHVTTGLVGERLSVLPGPEARSGTFTVATAWQLVEPLITAELTGSHGFELSPTPWLPDTAAPYVGADTLPIAYAGTGTPEELAAADVAGKVAVVSRVGDGQLNDQVQAAEAAGAAFVLAHNDRPGPWREVAWSTDFPVYLVDQDTGDRLQQALAADPTATLDVSAIRDHTYAYELAFTEPAVPSGTTYDTADLALATVTSDYHEPSERTARKESWGAFIESAGITVPYLTLYRRGPVERTEYVSTDDVTWARHAQPHYFPGLYWTSTPYETYEAGQTYHREWWGPLVHPGTPVRSGLEEYGMPVARFHDAIRIWLRHYLYDNTLTGTIFQQMGDTSELTLRRNGEVMGTAPWPETAFTVPAEEGDFELTLEVQNGPEHFSDTSVRTETTWGFRSGRPDAGERAVLPLIQVDYDLETGLYNEVPTGAAYPLVIDPGYQPGATGPEGFSATVEVSYDDGATWQAAAVDDVDGRFQATIPAAAGDGFATVRIDVADADGNRLTQQIDRAWKIMTDG